MSFITDIQNRVHTKTGLYTTWPPTDMRCVGEYGTIRNGRFVSEGSLDKRGVRFNVETKGALPSKLGFSDRVRYHTVGSGSAKLQASTRGASNKNAGSEAAIEIEMDKKGAFVYQLQNITSLAPDDKHDFFKQLFSLVASGKICWDEKKFVFIEEIRHAESATIIVLESDSGKIVLRGNISGGANDETTAPLAKAGAKITAEVESGSIFHAVGENSITPLFQLTKLNFDPGPNSGPTTGLSGLKAITDWWSRDVLRRAMPHEIKVRTYTEDPKSVRYECEVLGTDMRFFVVAKTLDFDEFLSLSQGEDDATEVLDVKEIRASAFATKSATG